MIEFNHIFSNICDPYAVRTALACTICAQNDEKYSDITEKEVIEFNHVCQ